MNKEEITIVLKRPSKWYPNYCVVPDISKDDLIQLMKSTKEYNMFIIPVYTKSIEELPDLSELYEKQGSEYVVQPMYVGANKELLLNYINKTVEWLYEGILDKNIWYP